MSRYAVSLDVAEEIKKENKEESQKVDINLEQLKKKLEEPKQEFEHHQHDHSHHHEQHEEEVHVTLDQLEKSLKEPKQTFTQPAYDYRETGGFFSFIKNHKILVFLILLMIFGYFYFNNDQAIANSQVSLQDASLKNIKNANKNKSITVLDDILTTGLTVSE